VPRMAEQLSPRRQPAWWPAVLLALVGLFAPPPAAASLPVSSSFLPADLRALPSLPDELPPAAARQGASAFGPKTRVRGFELGLHCFIGGEAGLTCGPRRAYGLRYGGHAVERSVFTGYLWDRETNLFYAKARFYDPAYGRFTSQDSFLGEINDPPSLHRYAYANDNPARFVDPTGHSAKDTVIQGLMFGVQVYDNLREEASNTYDRYVGGVANLFVPGATADAHVAAGQDPGFAGGEQLRLLAIARDSHKPTAARVVAFSEAAKAQVAVVVEETVIRPIQAAPGHARAIGTVLAHAEASTELLEQAVHVLGAVDAAAAAFNGLIAPAAIVSGNVSAGAVAEPELASVRGTVRSSALAAEPAATAPSGLRIINPNFTPDAPAVLQNITTAQNGALGGSPSLAQTVLTRPEYIAAQRSVSVARMQYGNAIERLSAQEIAQSPLHSRLFRHVGGPNQPDFVGTPGGPAQGMNFDITTPAAVRAHLARPVYGPGLNVVTYQRPPLFTLFP
jgi:RHS repeat-associated protein